MTASRTDIEQVAYQRVVVPLDGSELAERALPHAITLARATGAPIHLLRVVDILPLTQLSAVGPGGDPAAVFAELEIVQAEEGSATDYLEALRCQLTDRGLAAMTEVRPDLVVAGLLAALRSEDLLVMTTHGRTGLERLFFGSVAEAMIRHSPAPVLLVRAGSESTEETTTARAA